MTPSGTIHFSNTQCGALTRGIARMCSINQSYMDDRIIAVPNNSDEANASSQAHAPRQAGRFPFVGVTTSSALPLPSRTQNCTTYLRKRVKELDVKEVRAPGAELQMI